MAQILGKIEALERSALPFSYDYESYWTEPRSSYGMYGDSGNKPSAPPMDEEPKIINKHKVINNYYGMPSFKSSQEVIVVNNSSDKKEDEEKGLTLGKVLGTFGMSATIIGATFVLSKDEYVKLYMSTLSEDMKKFFDEGIKTDFAKDVIDCHKKYEEWLKAYKSRTGKMFYGKTTAAGSITGIFGSLIFGSPLFYLGMAGATFSACYCYLRYAFTDKRNEYIKFDEFRKSLDGLKLRINNVYATYPDLNI